MRPLPARSLVNRFAGGRAALHRARDLILFVILAALVSTAISARSAPPACLSTGLAEWSDYRSIWLTWWLGDAAGAIVVTPVLLLWYTNPRVAWSRLGRALKRWCSYLRWPSWDPRLTFVRVTFPLTFLLLPLGVWAGFRFGAREAATATCLLSVIAVWGTANGLGSFGRGAKHGAAVAAGVHVGEHNHRHYG